MENVTSQVFAEASKNISLSFEKASEITTEPTFFVPLIIYSALVIMIYLIWAGIAKNPNGTSLIRSEKVIIFLLMLVLFLAIGVLLTIFPVYLKFFG